MRPVPALTTSLVALFMIVMGLGMAGIWLIDNGFAAVHNLRGGVLSWRAKGRPIEEDAP